MDRDVEGRQGLSYSCGGDGVSHMTRGAGSQSEKTECLHSTTCTDTEPCLMCVLINEGVEVTA